MRRIRKRKKRYLPLLRNRDLFWRKAGTAFSLGLAVLFAGCGGESPKPAKVPMPPMVSKQPAQVPAKKPSPSSPPPMAIEPKTEPSLPVKYSYNPVGKTDPFKPLVTEKVEAVPKKAPAKPAKEGAVTPLERMDLSQVKLVAIIWDIQEPRAMVEDSAGNGYILSRGTTIGKNQGRVAEITSDAVTITEKVEPTPGKIKTREVVLRLYSD